MLFARVGAKLSRMKRFYLLCLLLSMPLVVASQDIGQLIQAYKRGEIPTEQIEKLKREYGIDVPRQPSVQRSAVRPTTAVSSVQADSVPVGSAVSTPVKPYPKSRIFGHNLFGRGSVGFEPSLSIATPKGYRLGAGDEVVVDVWGDASQSEAYTISPEGYIFVEGVGRISLADTTIEQAERRLRERLRSIYAGLDDGSVRMSLSLGSIRSIKVFVVGEVGMAGSYTVPSLATLFHLLHLAGGVEDSGGVRNIVIARRGAKPQKVDLYNYIVRGDASVDVALEDGDLVLVEPVMGVVSIAGEVKRPMSYELAESESLADLLEYAGGFAADANRNKISVVRRRGGEREHFVLREADMVLFPLLDGDSVSVAGGIDRDSNSVKIYGAVRREGVYALSEDVASLQALLTRAEGLSDDAFRERALLYREQDNRLAEVVAVNLDDVVSGRADVLLRPNDSLYISSVIDLREPLSVELYGSVLQPGRYPYVDGMTLADLLLAAGGVRQEASHSNVTVTRRIRKPDSMVPQDKLFENFTLSLSDDISPRAADFRLKPFDEVYVRRSPVYVTQSSVNVRGEVAFEGNYPLTHRNMRLSEIIADAGGLNPGAFAEGAYLLRRMTDNEQHQYDTLQDMIRRQADIEPTDSLLLPHKSQYYSVGINLADALASPRSDVDVVLRDGDIVAVPQYNATVRVMGAVLYPNSVTFREGERVKYYVKSAGGFGNRARRKHSFVIYMNGMVASGLDAEVRPGCIIIVPSKSETEAFRWVDAMGLLSTTASTAAIVASLINLAN